MPKIDRLRCDWCNSNRQSRIAFAELNQSSANLIVQRKSNDNHIDPKTLLSAMKNKLSKLLAALVLFSPAYGHAKPSPSPSVTVSAKTLSPTAWAGTKPRLISFHGIVASVDEKAKTFTVASKEKSRSIRVTDTSVITKLGVPATMKDIVVNEEVRGTCYKVADAFFDAKALKVGPLTEAEKAAEAPPREKRVEKKIGSSPAASPTASSSTLPKA